MLAAVVEALSKSIKSPARGQRTRAEAGLGFHSLHRRGPLVVAAAWICLPRIFPDPDQALARPLALHLHTTTTPLRGAPVSSTNLTALGPRRAQKPFASAPTPLLVVAFAFAPLAPTPSSRLAL